MQAAPSLLINGTLQGQAAFHHPYSKNASGMLDRAAGDKIGTCGRAYILTDRGRTAQP